MNVIEARTGLATALAGVAGVTYQDERSDVSDPPAVVLGPPSLIWTGHCIDPTNATFLVYVIEDLSEGAIERLLGLVPTVAAAIDALPYAAVLRAEPGQYQSAGSGLPTYELTVEVDL